MQKRTFVAAVIWKDGEVEDADEVEVIAASEGDAVLEAKKRWRTTVGLRWPRCVMQEVRILGPRKTAKTPQRAPPG